MYIGEIGVRYHFVRSSGDGSYAILVVHENGHFAVLTDDLVFDRGIGWAASGAIVPAREVPKETRRALCRALAHYVVNVMTGE